MMGSNLPPWLTDGKSTPDADPEKLEYALRYAAIGWRVLPLHQITPTGCSCNFSCESPGKHPRTAHGVKDASCDEATIRAWWRKWPEANIGIACGSVSGIVVLDIDPRNGGDATIEAIAGEFPDTPNATTGGGGQHYVFAYDPDTKLSASGLAGIDIQGDGKYVVVEPSSHISGNLYQWEASSEPWDMIPAPVPEWLVAAAGRKAAPEPVADAGDEWIPPETVNDLRSALNALDADDRDTWIAVGQRLKSLGTTGRELWMTWSQTSDKWQPKDARTWDTFAGQRTGYQAVFSDAARAGWVNPMAGGGRQQAQPLPPPPETITPLATVRGSELETVPVKDREWLLDGWIPHRETTTIYADAGTGKSLLAMQLAIHCVLGEPFFGINTRKGPAILVLCEDELDEANRRYHDIMRHVGCSYADLHDLHIVCRVGDDNLLMTFDGKDRGTLTPFWYDLDATVQEIRPVMLLLDTRTDIYGGNESDRSQVNAFVKRALTHIAKTRDCAVVVPAHPSVSGMISGTGTSGSTAWSGAVRSRTYLHRDDITQRVTWEIKKNNYGKTGTTIDMFWHEGVMIPYADATGLMGNTDAMIDQLVMELVTECQRREYNLSMSRQGNYAPATFVKMGRARKTNWTASQYEDSIERLLNTGRIRTAEGFGNSRGKTLLPVDNS